MKPDQHQQTESLKPSPVARGSAEWVNVDDALPPWKEYVLAYAPWCGGDRFMVARRLPSRAKNQEWQETSSGSMYRYGVKKRGSGQSITHWMRLTPPNRVLGQQPSDHNNLK